MIRTFLTIVLLAASAAVSVLASDNPQIRAPAPVRNFSLPFFNKEGHRTMLIRGNEARLTNPRRPLFVDMTLSLFTGDASNTIETIILSTEATVDTTTKTVEGTGPVRLVRDDIEVMGERWFYDYNDPDTINLRIERKARIVFRAELQSLLK